jgi:MFS family permease
VVPVADQIVLDLEGKERKSASVLLVTVWELGEAAGPLLIAPLSEIYGRYIIFNVANIVFILATILSALSQTSNMFIFTRFLTGFAVASNVLNPAIIGDIFKSEERASGMSLIMLAPLLGGAIGPAISGAIAETLGWRNILYMAAIVAIICEIAFFTLLRETYKVPILQRRAARLREETKNESLRCAFEVDGKSDVVGWAALRTAITRPVIVLVDSLVLQIISIYGGVVFTLYYIMATTFPTILREVYGFSPAKIGSSFLMFSLGATCGIIICNLLVDRIYISLGKSRGGVSIPEYRMPLLLVGSAILPFIVALYGWAPYAHWPLAFMLISVALIGVLVIVIWVPLASYVVDAFGLYSASAMTMVLIFRCLASTVVPLAIPALTDKVGLGCCFLILAGVFVALIPLPLLITAYGKRWRSTSKYTKSELA